MDNISKIYTHIWRKAQNDLMAPHRQEAEAVRVMRDLYAWGEIVVRSIDGNGFENESSVEGGVLGGTGFGVGHSERVGEAVKRFCDWLGDRDAWRDRSWDFGEFKNLIVRERDR